MCVIASQMQVLFSIHSGMNVQHESLVRFSHVICLFRPLRKMQFQSLTVGSA